MSIPIGSRVSSKGTSTGKLLLRCTPRRKEDAFEPRDRLWLSGVSPVPFFSLRVHLDRFLAFPSRFLHTLLIPIEFRCRSQSSLHFVERKTSGTRSGISNKLRGTVSVTFVFDFLVDRGELLGSSLLSSDLVSYG